MRRLGGTVVSIDVGWVAPIITGVIVLGMLSFGAVLIGIAGKRNREQERFEEDR